MTYPRSHSVWPPLLMAVLTLPLVACDEVDLPVTVDDAPLFTAVEVNALTAEPAHDADVTTGSTVPFFAEVAYQRTPEDVTALPTAAVNLFWATREALAVDEDGDTISYARSILGGSGTQDVSDERGVIAFTGDLTVPGTISSVCTRPYEGQTDAFIETQEEGPREISFSIQEATFNVPAQPINDECSFLINASSVFGAFEAEPWGTPIYVGGRNVTEAPAVHFPGTGFLIGTVDDPVVRFPWYPFNELPGTSLGFSSYWTWVPPGAADGTARVFTGGTEVPLYGGEARPQIEVPAGGVDTFEPNDEMADAKWDQMDLVLDDAFGEDILLFNPFLTLPAPDRTIDASKNPDGFSGWGVGDWHLIIPTLDEDQGTTEQDVCVAIFFDPDDDLDLFLYDPDGNLITFSAQSTGSFEFVGATTSTDLLVWVAPWMAPGEMNTTYGFYQVEGADCAFYEGTPQTVAGSVEKLQLMNMESAAIRSTPATVERPRSLVESAGFRLPSRH